MSRANQITAVRAVGALVCAGLVVGQLAGSVARPSWWLAAVAAPALLLDAVDGRVARLDGDASAMGVRFDVEVDAALVAILSVSAAVLVTPWALLVGAARYLYVAGGWVRPRWQAPLRPRRSRKVIGARVATLMRTSVVPGLPAPLREVCIVGSTALLAWSFGRDIADREGLTRRDTTPAPPTPIPREVPRALP